MSDKQMKNRWFEQPSGALVHGVGLDHMYIYHNVASGTYAWNAGLDTGNSGFPTPEAARQDAEQNLRERLNSAVEAMGGHIVWTGGRVPGNTSRPS